MEKTLRKITTRTIYTCDKCHSQMFFAVKFDKKGKVVGGVVETDDGILFLHTCICGASKNLKRKYPYRTCKEEWVTP